MAFFNEFPHTRFYDADLGWIIQKIKKLLTGYASIEEWRADHQTEYEILAEKVEGLINNLVDVISPWDAGIAYHVFSIVSYQGQNYIAVQDVPIGIMIDNTDYWQPANTVVDQINAMASVVSNLNRWRPYVTAEEYGAVGDGETDDTLAIERAIAGSIEEGKPLVFANKTYIISRTIVIDGTNIEIYCAGEIKYTGTEYAISLSGQFNVLHIDRLTARDGSCLLITPNELPAYQLDVNIHTVRGKVYGIKMKDYVDEAAPTTHRFGILYNRITCGRIRVDNDDEAHHAIDMESDYFIGETNLNIELIDIAGWALYAHGTGSINAIRAHLLAMEGDFDCIYLQNVHDSQFQNIRYSETVDTYGRHFLTMVGNCYNNIFECPSQLKLAAIDVTGITTTRDSHLNMPLMNASGRIIASGAKCNSRGIRFNAGMNSAVNIRNNFDFYPTSFNGALPTQFNVLTANTASDYLRIHLDQNYAWDGINRIQFVMNGADYRPVILNTAGNVLYDFRELSGTSYNGIYELVFNRSTDTTQVVNVYRYTYVTSVGDQPL